MEAAFRCRLLKDFSFRRGVVGDSVSGVVSDGASGVSGSAIGVSSGGAHGARSGAGARRCICGGVVCDSVSGVRVGIIGCGVSCVDGSVVVVIGVWKECCMCTGVGVGSFCDSIIARSVGASVGEDSASGGGFVGFSLVLWFAEVAVVLLVSAESVPKAGSAIGVLVSCGERSSTSYMSKVESAMVKGVS